MSRSADLISRILLGLALLSAPEARAQTGAAAWPAALANPKPLADDLVLPMPCGGQMVFRPVAVPASGLLDDRRISLGGIAADFAYKEEQHADYIAAGFTDAAHSAQRLYYVGKYDVTRVQFAALGATCPTPDDNARLPQTAITWTQANDFADAYTRWLIANAADRLPKEMGEPGFLRLPTEVEWEYAARGGARVSSADFAAPLFPMQGPLEHYVWFGGTTSANNELQPVGLLEPNPLGLFDMLGDAGQYAIDLFRLNHLSRAHGEAGGYVVRGGDYTTPAEQIRSSARDEFMPYDQRGARRQKTVGFRLVLTPPVLPSLQRVRLVEQQWQALPQAATTASAATLPDTVPDDPLTQVDQLAKATDDARMKRRLEELRTVMAANIRARDEQRDRAARTSINLAIWLMTKLQVDTRRLVGQQQAAAFATSDAGDRVKAQVAPDQRELDATLGYYRDTLQTIFSEYPADVRTSQAEVLRAELEQRNATRQVQLIPAVETDIAAFTHAGGLTNDALAARLRLQLCQSDLGRASFAAACSAASK